LEANETRTRAVAKNTRAPRQFKDVDMKVAPNTWHNLRVDFSGDHFKLSFDSKVALEGTDDTF
jgi:hypothetical protein